MRVLIAAAAVLLAGCASTHVVSASTPRSAQVDGPYWSEADKQRAFNVGEAECQKHGLHAQLVRAGGNRPNATWLFDCVR